MILLLNPKMTAFYARDTLIDMKILILRFSSFGDVTQCLSVPSKIQTHWPTAQIHWAVREDLSELLNGHPAIHKIWKLSRKSGPKGLLSLGLTLRKENFTHVYDAHNNMRSHVLSILICFFKSVHFLRKSQKRWKRFLLFKLRINKYKMPFSGQRDLIDPLVVWQIDQSLPQVPQLFLDSGLEKIAMHKNKWSAFKYIALAPSAAYELKRWPVSSWKKMIEYFPDENFVILGGPEDLFLNEIVAQNPRQILNLAGACSLNESSAIIKNSKALVTNDTGLLHVGEQLGIQTIALMGPAPFGYPSRPKTKIMELDLNCKPCSKHGQGPCVNSEYQKCLVGISAESVAKQLEQIIKSKNNEYSV